MRLSDVVLLLFIVLALVIRGRAHWKKTVIRVMIGVMIGDITGALLIAIFYHWHPSIIEWVQPLMPAGALTGGIYDIVHPAGWPEIPPRTDSESNDSYPQPR